MTVSEFCKALRRRLWSDSKILLLVRPAGKPLDDAKRKPCPGEFRMVTEENIQDCAAFEDAARYVPVYREMLARGDYGQYGYLGRNCVYREWLQQSGDLVFDGCKVRALLENECISHYVFCAPAARRNGFQSNGGARLVSLFPGKTFYTLVRPENSVSLKNFLRNGYEIQSLLTVKNRFFRRTLTEKVLSPEEANLYDPQ